MIKKVLTIAGSDCSGGAGIQADIKTITVHKMYAMSVITSLTAQNTTGVYGIYDVTPAFVQSQLDCVFNDIFPDAVKIGMVSNAEIIKVIAKKLVQFNAKNIVIDPVMVSTSGCRLITEEAEKTLVAELLPLANVITPNVPEAEVLSGIAIKNESDMHTAAEILSKKINTAVLIKGGHLKENTADLLYENGNTHLFKTDLVNNENTHGTGCTLSSAVACNMANGLTLPQSVKLAKEYLTGALKAQLNLGKGKGPLLHNYNI